MDNETPKCPRCNGSKWIRGLVGGIYDCPDCWEFEETQRLLNTPQRLYGGNSNSNSLKKHVETYAKSENDLVNEILPEGIKLTLQKPKRKYVRKEKTRMDDGKKQQ